MKFSKRLLFINDKQLEFEHDIRNVVEFDSVVILHLLNDDNNVSKQPIDNIFAVSKEGNILWNIKDIIQNSELYVSIWKDDSNILGIAEFSGLKKKINLVTLEVTNNSYTK